MAQNILALYGVQAVNYLLPLITVPFLTRVLGAQGWGLFAFFQSFGLYATTLVDYSFAMAATREVSRQRDDHAQRSDLLAGVIGAKLLLSSGVILICLVAQPLVPVFGRQPLLFWMGISWAITLSFNLLWYFQGLERMRTVAALDLSAKSLATAAIFLFISIPEEAWKVFLFYSLANLLSLLAAAFIAYRQVPFRLPSWRLSMQALKYGWQLFIARVSVNLFTVGNNFIMGLFAPPLAVGFFAGSEKISKATASLANPVTQALFPRLSLIVESDPRRALALVRRSFLFLVSISACLSLFIFLAAPLLTRYLLGAGYEEATPVLRVMSLLPLFIALTNVFGVQWMLALRMDTQFNVIVICSALLNLGLAALLVPRWQALGMACAVVCAEFTVMAATYLTLLFYKVHPLHNARMIISLSPNAKGNP